MSTATINSADTAAMSLATTARCRKRQREQWSSQRVSLITSTPIANSAYTATTTLAVTAVREQWSHQQQ